MVMLICPKCLKKNYVSDPNEKIGCEHCNHKFSIKDLIEKLQNKDEKYYTVNNGCWISIQLWEDSVEMVETICPKCFKVFMIFKDVDLVWCVYCRNKYKLPRLNLKLDEDK